VGGSSWSGTSYDYILLKYSPGGVLRWAARYDGPDHGDDLSYAMAVDRGGNIYLTGQSFGNGSGADYATVKFSPDGVILWAARYNGTLNNDDRALSVAVNSTGNAYVTGWSAGADNTYDMVTIMYDSAGAQKWIAIYASPEHKNDMAAALALDKNGNTYVTGRSYTSGQDDGDYIVIRYDSTGTERWVARYDGPGGGDDEPRAIAVDSGGFVYVTGRSVGTDGSYDFATLKYSPSGILQWDVRYASPTKSDDDARSIVVDGLGNVVVTGMSHGLAWSDITIIKYSQTVTSVRRGEAVLPGTFQLFQNYPNPFNSMTVIAYRLPVRSHVTLKLYNILGQEVASLVNETQEAGPRLALWRAAASSGVYFYRLNAVDAADPRRSFSEVRKMVLLE
jgi:hypothetical protein